MNNWQQSFHLGGFFGVGYLFPYMLTLGLMYHVASRFHVHKVDPFDFQGLQ